MTAAVALDDSEPRPEAVTAAAYVDEVAVQRVINGAAHHGILTAAERRDAVRRLHRRGLSDLQIGNVVGLAQRSVFRIRKNLGLPANGPVAAARVAAAAGPAAMSPQQRGAARAICDPVTRWETGRAGQRAAVRELLDMLGLPAGGPAPDCATTTRDAT